MHERSSEVDQTSLWRFFGPRSNSLADLVRLRATLAHATSSEFK
jgi:hypothetical protein